MWPWVYAIQVTALPPHLGQKGLTLCSQSRDFGDSQLKVPLLPSPGNSFQTPTFTVGPWEPPAPTPLLPDQGYFTPRKKPANFLKRTARPLITTPPLVRPQKYSSKPKWLHLVLNRRPGKIKALGHGQAPRLSCQCGLGIAISLPNRFALLQNGQWHLLWSSQVYFSASWRFNFKVQWQVLVCQWCFLKWGAVWGHSCRH